MSKKSDDRKNVVIVGGGGYGGLLARDLSGKLDPSKYNLVLISARPYYVHLLAAARFTVSAAAGLENRALVPYDKLFVNGNGTFVLGKATSIADSGNGQGGQVALENGEKIPYDILVLATGSSFSGPIAFPDSDDAVRDHLKLWRERYAAARDIVFIGGGAVGIGEQVILIPCSQEIDQSIRLSETAGEVLDAYPVRQTPYSKNDLHR